MIRSSRHKLIGCNKGKIASIDNLFVDYKHDLLIYINYIVDGVLPLKNNLSSALLPAENIKHSRYKQLIYKHASSIIRSQVELANKRRFNKYKRVYAYMAKNHPESPFVKIKYSKLHLKDITRSKYFTIPKLERLTIGLDERFFDIESSSHFDLFVNIKLPYFNNKGTKALQTNLPLNNHKHSEKLASDGFNRRKNIQIKKIKGEYYINLTWEKTVEKRATGKTLGIDIGVNKLMVTSDGDVLGDDLKALYQEISRKKKYSKNYYKKLSHRNNLFNYYVNRLQVDDVKTLVIEELKNVKYKTSFKEKTKSGLIKNNKKGITGINNVNEKWVYRYLIDKIERACEENGIKLVKVSPAYTSQTCSLCGCIDKESRNKESFRCVSCGYEIDADYNASINIRNRGAIVPLASNFVVFHNNE